jgi:hypothetical protein
MAAVTAVDGATALRGWLLSDRVLVRLASGAAVSGSVDGQGQPLYSYPEIAGYWLWWLSDPSLPVQAAERERTAPAVVAWLHALSGRRAWPTRLSPPVPPSRSSPRAMKDWRNRTVFAFDVAMVLRGLAGVEAEGIATVPPDLVFRLQAELMACVTPGGDLAAHGVTHRSSHRWSTRPGAYQAKMAAALGVADARWPMPAALGAAVSRVREERGSLGAGLGHRELHPALYHAEGVLLGPDGADPGTVVEWWRTLMRHADGRCGLPEAVTSARCRTDVWAQALRIGVWLDRAGVLDGTEAETVDDLAAALTAAIDGGGLLFRPPGEHGAIEYPVWAALFAEQALRWWSARDRVDMRWLV